MGRPAEYGACAGKEGWQRCGPGRREARPAPCCSSADGQREGTRSSGAPARIW